MECIRLANKTDISQLFTLYKSEGWHSFSEDKIRTLFNSSTYLVLENDGELIAFARCLTDGAVTTFVAELLVAKDYRGRGMGKLLIREIQTRMAGTRLELISEADGFYETVGFRAVGQGYRLA
ncbi:GNAT family N-acetyltransferase [Streptococcus caprae]|uniref:GNAT family N-acetyltransferase n=1 Tax=Streptococcus caprae TaxID=1640501 RepID=A0ABV8CUN9_9STRE